MNNPNLLEVVLDMDLNDNDVVLNLLSDNKYIKITQRIFSKEHSAFKSGQIIEPHFHDCYEFEFLVEGTMQQYIEDKKYTLKPNGYILISPSDIHSCKMSDDTLIVLNIQFQKDILSDSLKSMLEFTQFPIVGEFGNNSIEYFAKNISALQNTKFSITDNGIYKQMLYSALESFVLYIIGTSNTLNIPFERLDHKHNTNILKAISYIKKNFTRSVTVDEVSEICGYTPNYFSRKFREVTGKCFVDYINNERLIYAYNLITMTDDSIQNICIASGFGDLKHFYKCFSQKFQCTPGSLRKANIIE